MSVSSTNLSGNNVTAFNRHRRIAAERARAEAEAAERARAEVASPSVVVAEAETPAPQPPPPEPNVRMTKAQLVEIAAERGVDVSDEMTKAQLVEAINSHNAALVDTPAKPKGPFDEAGE